MFKTTDKISKAMDLIIKVAEEINDPERKEEALSVIHELSVLHSKCFNDLRKL